MPFCKPKSGIDDYDWKIDFYDFLWTQRTCFRVYMSSLAIGVALYGFICVVILATMGHFAIDLKESVKGLNFEMEPSRFFLEHKSKKF
jgi:hypothetical protein